MTQMVTRCPKCATAFRITSTQLESAKGSVRCGSCLHIFKAQEHLVTAPAGVQTPQKPTERPLTSSKVASNSQPTSAARSTPVPATRPTGNSSAARPVANPTTANAGQARPAVKTSASSATPGKPAVGKPVAPAGALNKATPDKPKQAPTATTQAKPVAVTKPVIDKAKVLADEEDVLISDDMDKPADKESTYEFDGFGDINMNPKQTVSLFEREIRFDSEKDDETKDATDESWAEQLLSDDDEPIDHRQMKSTHQSFSPTPAARQTPKPAPTPVQAEVVKSEVLKPEIAKPKGATAKETIKGDSAPLFSFVSEKNVADDEYSDAFISATTPLTESTTKKEDAESFGAALFEEELLDEEDQDTGSSKKPVKSSNKTRSFDTSRAALLMNIMPAPVEFTAKRVRRWYQKKLWPSLALFAGVALFFQIAYFKIDYFGRVEPYRTGYVLLCPLFGCKVPSLVDTSKIVTNQLIVRNHPDAPNALMVDAILINNAPFEQPFPDLILTFSTLDDKPISSRRFTPKEYLGGELAGRDHIPKSQPVHITLELADPGPEAVNYHMSIP